MISTTFRFIFKPDVQFKMDAGREIIAALSGDLPRANELFHYGANGMPLPGGMPMVRTHSRRNLIDVIALGESAALVESFVPAWLMGFAQQFGSMPSLQINADKVSVDGSVRAFDYVAYSVVIDRGLPACERFEQMDESQRGDKAHDVLVRGLRRQADTLGLSLPDTLPVRDSIAVLKYHPRAPIVRGAAGVAQHGISVNIGFKWEAAIAGSWSVGALTSKGHGRVWYVKDSGGEAC